MLAGAQSVSDLAREHEVSRKFLYQQARTAEEALREAFPPSSRSDYVLFYLPVTKTWLRQLVLALVLICHSSVRGVVELLRDVFDYRLSVGTVHNIVHKQQLLLPGQSTNNTTSPALASVFSMREIFQASDPVFVGVVMPNPTFCFLPGVRNSIATPIPGASGYWNWSTKATLPMLTSPISARDSAPGTRKLYLEFLPRRYFSCAVHHRAVGPLP